MPATLLRDASPTVSAFQLDDAARIADSESLRDVIRVLFVGWPRRHGNANDASEKANLGHFIDVAYRDLLCGSSPCLRGGCEEQDRCNEQLSSVHVDLLATSGRYI
jgi:hypothetical protein